MSIKVNWDANIRSRYNQIPHPTQDTTWESDKNTRKHHTQERQWVFPFSTGDYKATRNRQYSMTDTHETHPQNNLIINNKKKRQFITTWAFSFSHIIGV